MDSPLLGQDIYVPTALYLGHGRDDVCGGLARVVRIEEGISAGRKVPFVAVAEHPGRCYNWEILSSKQEELRTRFGHKRAYPDPDYRPEFNEP